MGLKCNCVYFKYKLDMGVLKSESNESVGQLKNSRRVESDVGEMENEREDQFYTQDVTNDRNLALDFSKVKIKSV